jgi:cytochrome P450
MVATTADPILFNPFDPVWKADPYPVYRRLRTEAPIGQIPFLGIWYLTRFADCERVLSDPRMGSDTRKSDFYRKLRESRGIRMPDDVGERRSFLFLDPPDHTRLRGLVASTFTPKIVNGLRPRIQQLVDELLDAAVGRGSLDIVSDLAYPLPFNSISDLLGIPIADQPLFRAWSQDMAGSNDPMMDPPPEVVDRQTLALKEGSAYLRSIIAEHRRQPREDLLSALIAAEQQGDKLTEDELLSTVILLIAAGHETTASLIGNAVLALLNHPDQLRAVRAESATARLAIEETLRWDPPVQMTQRVALDDIEIDGHHVDRGSPVIVVLGAANRDEQVNPDGESFDIGRDPIHHLAYGFGPHFCLGAALARAEASIAVGTVVSRFPSLRLAPDGLRRREDLVMRGLEALPVEID